MHEKDALRLDLAGLLESQRLAVLSTHETGQPYASLVSFAATPDLRHLLFATTRATRKYANLRADPRAAMLVDNRSNREEDIHLAVAVTATGVAEEVSAAARRGALAIYLEKHPYLGDFVNAPSCALLRLTVRTYFLVRRFQNVIEFHMAP